MKLKRSLLLLVLGFALAGCNASNQNNISGINLDSEIVALYNTYKENGGTLSYEDWLISVKGEKGDKGDKGDTGPVGPKGDDGYTPYIGDNGNWWINNEDTGYKAIGQNGQNGKNGNDGVSITGVDKINTSGNIDTYQITFSNNNTFEFTVTNGTNGSNGAQGPTGPEGPQGPTGPQGPAGNDGVSVSSIVKTGTDGLVDTYTITYSNNTTSTFTVTNGADGQNGAQCIQGNPGNDGHTPEITISNDGYWVIDGNKTSTLAQGVQGPEGPQGPTGPQGPAGNDGVSVSSIVKTSSDGLVDTYTITYSNNTTSTFTITNGADGQNGSQGIQGNPGQDGHTPEISISNDGYWVIDGNKTSTLAQGVQGPKGDQGIQGETGPQGPTGPQGEQGIQGNPGADGSTILSGSENPDNSLGKDGDMYLNTSSYDVFEKSDGIWTLTCNIKGLKGDTGVSVVSTLIDENGDLIVTFSNDQVVNAGHVKDVTKYTVEFYCGNDLVATRTVEPNSKIETPTSQETAGYTITSWHVDGYDDRPWVFSGYYADRVTENVKLCATYTSNTYQINFVDQKFGKSLEPLEVTYNAEYNITQYLEEKGYTFCDWNDSENNLFPLSGTFRFAKNISLYANWNANNYTVTLNPGYDGGETTSQSVTFDSNYSLPALYRNHYVFLGWYDGDTRISNNAIWKIDHDITLTGKWNGNANTYVFDAGNGTVNPVTINIEYGAPYELPIPTIGPSSNGIPMVFDYWELGGQEIERIGDAWEYESSERTIVAHYKYDEDYLLSMFKFKDIGNGYEISKFSNDSCVGDISIPEIYRNKPVVSIGSSAFYCCSSLTSIIIPDSVTSIGDDAFRSCSSLTSIIIPDSVTSIGDDAFSFCGSLVYMIVDDNNPKYDSRNNCNAIISKNDNVLVAGCLSTIIPDSVTSIEHHAFSGRRSLTSITIPDSVTSIGGRAFCDCISLTSIIIPDSVTLIGDNAFYCCSSLTSIIIPDSVTSIRTNAFYGCNSLSSIIIPDSVTTVGSYAFPSITIVYYEGNNLKIPSGLNGIAYSYSEVEPTTSGKYWHYVNGVPTIW